MTGNGKAKKKNAAPGGEGQPVAESRVGRPLVFGVSALAGVGLLSLVLYAQHGREPLAVIGAGVLIAAAAATAGGALGFLFGIPRVLGAPAEPSAGDRQTYAANTNLEQISDWLTKLLVGAGLTQLGSLGAGARQLTASLGPALGGRPDSATMAGALLIEFVVLGFLVTWLLTRLLLASAFTEADRRALDSFVLAENLSDLGDYEQADELRARARGVLGLPYLYEEMRRQLPAGEGRTAQMQALVDAARATAHATTLTSAQVKELFDRSEGQRIYALAIMQGAPELADFPSLLEAIERSHSAFEQYQALVLAEILAHSLEPQDRSRLHQILLAQLDEAGRLKRSSNRRRIAERVISRLNRSILTPVDQISTSP